MLSTRPHTASSLARIAGSRASGAVMIAVSSAVSIGEGVRPVGSARANSSTIARAVPAFSVRRATIAATSTASSPCRQQS